MAKNDRNKTFKGNVFQEIPTIRNILPRQFDEATNRTIELIDVLWLQSDAIVAAFEVEHTTAIYSGLLRMSDLISMQPNIKINLYIVAPDQRREKVFDEINRPTFARLKPPLPQICKFIPYSELMKKLQKAAKLMKPEHITQNRFKLVKKTITIIQRYELKERSISKNFLAQIRIVEHIAS